MKRHAAGILTLIFCLLVISGPVSGMEKTITMSTTTSTENSGLLDELLPQFTADTGIGVKVIAKGTGAAIRDGMDGNADIIFVHAKEREEKFVSEGYGAYRLAVMHNDFIVIGPKNDPAATKGVKTAPEALKRISDKKAPFISRGDDSGTHTKEQELWKLSDVVLKTETTEIIVKGKSKALTFQHPEGLGDWYYSVGQGMGKALTFAEEKQAYTLTDRGTYLQYKYGRKEGLDLDIMVEGDPALFNPYGIIPVNPKKYPQVKFEMAEILAKWLVSEKAQRIIADYKIQGKQAFFPDAVK